MAIFQKRRLFLGGISLLLLCLVFGLTAFSEKKNNTVIELTNRSDSSHNETLDLYENLDLEKMGLSREAFLYALKGYKHLQKTGKLFNDAVISVIDFSLPSTQKRFFVIDLENDKLLFHTYVSHGKNSGKLIAKNFSNKSSSYQSSLGLYTTGSTYFGKHGFSLRLIGMEKGINDQAMKRGIVIHSADYASETFALQQGYLGRSQGCPAIPEDVHKALIETIENRSCLFIYSPVKLYSKQSKLI